MSVLLVKGFVTAVLSYSAGKPFHTVGRVKVFPHARKSFGPCNLLAYQSTESIKRHQGIVRRVEWPCLVESKHLLMIMQGDTRVYMCINADFVDLAWFVI